MVDSCSSFQEIFNKGYTSRTYRLVITNLNLHRKDHTFMDGLSVLRHFHSRQHKTPVIIYTDDLNILNLNEIHTFKPYKILDSSKINFNENLLQSVRNAIKVIEWREQFDKSIKNKDIVYNHVKNIPFVSPIRWNYHDENLYNCFFASDSYNHFRYANNWAYILQATRANGYKFFNGSCLLTITTNTTKDDKNFNFVLINPLGEKAVRKTVELADHLGNISGRPVIIKRMDEMQEKHFLKYKRCKVLKSVKSNRLEDQDDDNYPQIVVNLKSFMYNINYDNMTNFRRNLRKFSRLNFTYLTTTPDLFEDFLGVVLRWKRSFIKRYEEREEFEKIPLDDSYYTDPYVPIFAYFSRFIDNKNYLSSIVYVEDIPVGFSFLGKVSKVCMGMYANLADTNYEGLSEFMLYHNFTKAYWSGYKYVNLGGTESEYLYKFYKKFKLDHINKTSFELDKNCIVYK